MLTIPNEVTNTTNYNLSSDNKIVLITGGTSGIGLETARQFIAQGAQVIVTGVTTQRLDVARKELGEKALVLSADLRHAESLDAVISEITQRFGRLDVVFANAGAGTASPLEDVTAAQINEQFALNFNGAFFTVQKSAPLLSKGASVILIPLIEIADAYKEVSEDPTEDPTLKRKLIWAIGKDDVLFVAEDIPKPAELGHPSMTGMQAARIAGEIRHIEDVLGGQFLLWPLQRRLLGS